MELSYQDNSIEIIDTNWESMGDESTLEILQDFDSKENVNYQNVKNLPLQRRDIDKVKMVRMGCASS